MSEPEHKRQYLDAIALAVSLVAIALASVNIYFQFLRKIESVLAIQTYAFYDAPSSGFGDPSGSIEYALINNGNTQCMVRDVSAHRPSYLTGPSMMEIVYRAEGLPIILKPGDMRLISVPYHSSPEAIHEVVIGFELVDSQGGVHWYEDRGRLLTPKPVVPLRLLEDTKVAPLRDLDDTTREKD